MGLWLLQHSSRERRGSPSARREPLHYSRPLPASWSYLSSFRGRRPEDGGDHFESFAALKGQRHPGSHYFGTITLIAGRHEHFGAFPATTAGVRLSLRFR